MEAASLHLLLMAAEALVVAVLVLSLASMRRALGMAPLYLAIGSLQYLQMLLASSIYVEVAPGFLVSPGSAVLFTGTLFGVLVTYLLEDAPGARRIIYGVVLANLVLGLLSWMVSFHADGPGVHNYLDLPAEAFAVGFPVLGLGTLALFLDVVVLVLLYEALGRLFRRLVFPRVLLALWAVLTLDTVLFVGGLFWDHPDVGRMLAAGLSGKLAGAVIYAACFAAWVRVGGAPSLAGQGAGHVLSVLTWRERYEDLEARLRTDLLTGLGSRAWFVERGNELLGYDARDPAALLVLDIDRFKRVNDSAGHSTGDEVLRRVGAVVQAELRESDVPARIGGEEFAIILPGVGRKAATATAERLRSAVAAAFAVPDDLVGDLHVTVTIGVACSPGDAVGRAELFEVADRRMYAGKNAGRDRVVAQG